MKPVQEEKFILFNLKEEEYGINIRYVQEINRLNQEIVPIPETSDFISGIMNLRGKIIPVIDLRKKFNLLPKEADRNTRIIIARLQNRQVGIMVDAVFEVISVLASDIEPPEPMIATAGYLGGIGKYGGKIFLIISIEKLLTPEEKNELSSLAQKSEKA